MSIVTEKRLKDRSGSVCEISGSDENLVVYLVEPKTEAIPENCILITKALKDQIENPEIMDLNLWRCLNDSMWSEHLPVQILSWRMLNRLGNLELVEQMYLEEDDLVWAKASGEGEVDENKIIHRDSNGVILETGDSVVLIKDLKVKGSSMVAKQGTAVRNIRLDYENAEYIEGRVDGQTIVIITQYVKKI
jgi:protein PhnA